MAEIAFPFAVFAGSSPCRHLVSGKQAGTAGSRRGASMSDRRPVWRSSHTTPRRAGAQAVLEKFVNSYTFLVTSIHGAQVTSISLQKGERC